MIQYHNIDQSSLDTLSDHSINSSGLDTLSVIQYKHSINPLSFKIKDHSINQSGHGTISVIRSKITAYTHQVLAPSEV